MRGFLNIRIALGNQFLRKKKNQVSRNRSIYNFDTAKTAGILFDGNEEGTFQHIKEFSKFLKSKGIQTKLLGYVESKELPDEMVLWDNCDIVSLKEIDLLLKPKSPAAQEFLQTEFNILFDLSLKNYFTLHYISTLSPANFKVGRFTEDENDFDFMINVNKRPAVDYLIEHIRNYLSTLNKNIH